MFGWWGRREPPDPNGKPGREAATPMPWPEIVGPVVEVTSWEAGGDPVWGPLEAVVGKREVRNYWFESLAETPLGTIYSYKHRLSRRCLNIDRAGRFWFSVRRGDSPLGQYGEITREAALAWLHR